MCNKIISWLILYFKLRAFKLSTLIGLVLLCVLIFYKNEMQLFLQFLFEDALKKLIENLVNSDTFITGIATAIIAYLAGTKKF